jgi:uncharacterized protein (TIGR02246 family)
MSAEDEIRALIERWAAAAHTGDLDVVLDRHSADIVMYDVPRPFQGNRGIESYRESWPGFFRWQASGASYDIEELSVTAGVDVAFAFGLLRCGMPADFEREPEQRLRLTVGLHKVEGEWVVTHEHHSFTDTSD